MASTEKDYAQGDGLAGGGDFPAILADRLATAIVKKPEVQSVIKMLGLDDMDVVSEGVTYALGEWEEYDDSKATESTFLHQRVNSGIYNFLRRSGSQFRTEQRSKDLLPKDDKERDLCDWLKDVFEAAKRVYLDKRHNQRRTYPLPQIVAIANLMQNQNLSGRECARLLASRDDLRHVIRLKTKCPTYRTINRAARLIGRKEGFPHVPLDRP